MCVHQLPGNVQSSAERCHSGGGAPLISVHLGEKAAHVGGAAVFPLEFSCIQGTHWSFESHPSHCACLSLQRLAVGSQDSLASRASIKAAPFRIRASGAMPLPACSPASSEAVAVRQVPLLCAHRQTGSESRSDLSPSLSLLSPGSAVHEESGD